MKTQKVVCEMQRDPALSSRRPKSVVGLLAARLSMVDPRHWLFSGVEFTYWFAAAASGYLTVFLQGRGMSSSEVGVIGAINSAVAILAAPFWGAISDKLRSIRKVLMLCLAVGAVLWAAVPLSSSIYLGPLALAMVLIPVGSFFRSPASSLKDSWVVQNANVHRLNYGSMRLWGSISYAIMAIGLSMILPSTGVECTFYIYGIATIPLLVLVWRIKDDGQKVKSLSFREMQIGRLFKDYYFVTFLIFSVALNMPANTAMSFFPYLIDCVGGDTAQLGLVMGYKALLEIPVLILMVRMRRRFPFPVIIGMAAVMYVAESLLYSVASGMFSLVLISTFHGLGGGILIGAASNYIYGLTPDGLKATAQTVYGSMNSLAGIVGNLLGGYLMDTIGVRSFYCVAGLLILAALAFFTVSFPLGRLLKKPLPAAAQRQKA